jgi:YggT family protein
VTSFFHLLARLVEAYIWLIMFPYAILSWFRVQPGSTLARVQYFLFRATEPLLRPVRKIIPPVAGLDSSFLVVILVLQIVVVDQVLYRV